MAGLTFSGLGNGIDVQGLVDQLMYVESAPVRRIQSKISALERKVSAFNDLSSKLTSLSSKLDVLNSASQFAAHTASSSNESVLTASASSDATPGSYQIEVTRLALLDNFASDTTFATSSTAIGTGSFSLSVGSSSATITINSSNATLEGLRDAINNAGLDVTANIVNTGSGYRLTMTSQNSGADNAISVSSNTLTLSDGLTPFTFSRTHSIASASELDASLKVNGLTVTSSSNQVTGVIDGVTLNLVGTSASAVSLTVANDTATVKSAIEDFVSAFNEAYTFINSQFTYSEASKQSGTLAGESVLRTIQSDLALIVTRQISGVSGSLDNLAAVGISVKSDGTLEVDSSELDSQLSSNFSSVKSLFIAVGTATNSAIQVLGQSSKTSAGTYTVDITAAPEKATVTGPNAIAGTLGVNESLTVTLGGVSSIVALTSSMTLDTIVSTLNTQFATDGLKATATADGSNHLVISSNDKGKNYTVNVVSDLASGGLGFGTTGLSATGVDVAGTFTNTATGSVTTGTASDDVLIGGSGDAEGLRVLVNTASTGTFGTVTVTLGYAELLQRRLESITDSLEGPISGTVEGMEKTITGLKDDIDRTNARLEMRRASLVRQFSKANEALQNLSYLQSSLSAQLSKLG